MPPKKRKQPPSQATLLQFFSPSKAQKLAQSDSASRRETVAIDSDPLDDDVVLIEETGIAEEKISVQGGDDDVISLSPEATSPTRKGAQLELELDTKLAVTQQGPSSPSSLKKEPVTESVIGVHASQSSAAPHSVKVSLQSYDPKALPPYWQSGKPTPFAIIASSLRSISLDKGRIAASDALANLLRSVLLHFPADILSAVYLLSGTVAPSFEGLELGVGGQVIVKAAREVSGVTTAEVKRLLDEKGDLGDAVMEMKIKQTTLFKLPPLTVSSVFTTLRSLAQLKGANSQATRQQRIQRLLSAAQGEEVRWLVRILTGNLRSGTAKLTLLGALAKAAVANREWDDPQGGKRRGAWNKVVERTKEMEAVLRSCWSVCPSWDILVPALFDPQFDPLTLSERLRVHLHIPIRPMLGKITKDLPEALDKLDGLSYVADWKYDGQRAQIHWGGGVATIFSRHLENNTGKFFDVVNMIPQACVPTTSSFILDAEIVAIDGETGKHKPFQVLSNRPKKTQGELADLKGSDVCVYPFDLLYLNGESLMQKPLRERLHLLHASFSPVRHRFQFTNQLLDAAQDDVETFLSDALAGGAEGLMLKLLDEPPEEKKAERGALLATYEPDKRCNSWLKVKKDYSDSFRTFDLVVIGAWWGNGRKAGWYSPFLLACWNPKTERYESVCKVMSGFTDDFYREQLTAFTRENGMISPKRPSGYEVDDHLTPDMWFEPVHIWEIRGADLTLSPTHSAARGVVEPTSGRGVSLRFPRFVRVRTDKGLEDVTTSMESMYIYVFSGQVGLGVLTHHLWKVAEAYGKQVLVQNSTLQDDGPPAQDLLEEEGGGKEGGGEISD
ncbi:ATP-dependent DNA ligase [Gonapodya prolifera JEL478]|uniref:DNA ligase n=1 Tax=Gonapodya prolifera (strain JEL478) TaxID=1344416 RepID=A0A139A4A9_GONPJ|nr:ATP-dependent DNA ligase [Gonapodya prolifera JEL478]|eukprot:KXS11631.1 ATP-dependent DNA ligase [Gonapodya prolifera JEL478]